MKGSYFVVGLVMIVIGLIWFFQGINVLPGSFMTGDPKWAWIGGICAVGGIAMVIVPRLLKH